MENLAPASVPVELKDRGFCLRPETASDADFLLTLYLSVRWHELAVTNWPDASKRAFLVSQFQTQKQQYGVAYLGLERRIIEGASGPLGRLYLLSSEREVRVVDISLLAAWRNQGIGTALLLQLGCEADRARKQLCLQVELHNPALRLYQRLGFQARDTSGPYWDLERQAAPSSMLGKNPLKARNARESACCTSSNH
jgi:ribosomal protein S18 acetylase RimI-like enzyme